MRKLLLLFGLGSFGVGAYLYYSRQIKLLEKLTYKVVGVKIEKFTPLTIIISTELTNQSEISFTIKGYDIDVVVNGQKVAKVKNAKMNEVLKGFGAKSNINVVTKLAINESGGNIGSLLQGIYDGGIDSTQIELRGFVSIKIGLFVFSDYPVEIKWNLEEFL